MLSLRPCQAGMIPQGGLVITPSIKRRDLGAASPLKLRVARIVTSGKVGRPIGTASGNRARHHGL